MKKLLTILSVSVLIFAGCTKEAPKQPTFSNISETTFSVGYEGATIEVEFTLDNPVKGKAIDVNINVDWIELTEQSEGYLQFEVEESEIQEMRTASIMVSHAEQASFTIEVHQEAVAITKVAEVLSGFYYGTEFTPNTDNYYVHLSNIGYTADGDPQAGGWYYTFDMYNVIKDYPENSTNILLPEGTYTLTNDGAAGTFSTDYSSFFELDEAGQGIGDGMYEIEAGTIVVTANSIEATLTIDGQLHKVSYTGELIIKDGRKSEEPEEPEDPNIDPENGISTLIGDLELDLSSHIAMFEYYEDWWEVGCTNYVMLLAPESGIGGYITMDFVTGDLTTSLAGTYSVGNNQFGCEAPFTYIPGSFFSGEYIGAWYNEIAEDESMPNSAPIIGGTMTITENGDGNCTIVLDLMDDKGNKITGTWTGEPINDAPTAASAQKSLLSTIQISTERTINNYRK